MTDSDRNFGPVTIGPWSKTFSIAMNSYWEEEDPCAIRFIAFGWALRIRLPNIIPPLKIKHVATTWDEETVKRMGRNWYYEIHQREFGFSLSDMGNGYDFLQIFYGPQTHSSEDTASWCTHLPWKEWKHVRTSYYNPDGTWFHDEDLEVSFLERFPWREECPKSHFEFQDFDGQRIIATCMIEEREWHKGAGWFKWLKYFAKPKICRSLDLKFSEEVGPDKGSWKGGTVGHGIDMLPNETPTEAFKRYCEKEHDARGNRKFRLKYLRPCGAPPPKPCTS